MERESFEDREVAALLNSYFIAVKVDREERPDVDHIYMEFCQALTGAGGWPLSIIMTPDKKPFFAGTYFPKTTRYGRAGLMELLSQIIHLWQEKPNRLLQSAENIFLAMQKHVLGSAQMNPLEPNAQNLQPRQNGDKDHAFRQQVQKMITSAYSQFESSFDDQYGGFGTAPKFPSPHILGFLMRCSDESRNKANTMVRRTLDGMAHGGINDHIGFGFARYSTDGKWLVPHFEKMLYDNALLAYTYLEGFQALHDQRYLRIAQEIFTYILRDMTSPEGGFYCAEDADSEGIEGKFYLWTQEEIVDLLGTSRAASFMKHYGITSPGNYEGKNIPNTILSSKTVRQTARTATDLPEEKALAAELEACRRILFSAREKRVHPYKDDKILVAWNGLMIAALAKGFLITHNETYITAAEKALHFINTKLTRNDGRLLARYRDGEASHLGYLNDYAYLIWGLLECYMATGLPKYLETALKLQNEQDKLFYDVTYGGYFLTGSDSEKLLFRPKEIYDGATPSGNSVSTMNLLRLARLTADAHWEARAEEQLHAFIDYVKQSPGNHAFFLQAYQFAFHSSQELIFTGPLNSPEQKNMTEIIGKSFLPYATLIYQEGSIDTLIPWLKDYPTAENETKCYYCEGFSCQQPVSSAAELAKILSTSTHL